ncbi:unnamed protein product [Colias eurytheme]|nr:unnamed protein product [Colias eurytheme]
MLSTLSSLPDKVEKLRNDLNDLTSKINPNVIEDMYKRIEDIDIKLSLGDRLNEDIQRLKSQVKGFEGRLHKYEVDLVKSHDMIKNLQTTVTSLERESKRTEQKSRFLNVEIVGIPEESSENLLQVFFRLASAINCDLNKEDIEFITRVQSFREKRDSPRKIVAKLRDKLTKDTLISNFKKCNKTKSIMSHDLGFTGTATKIFINEHLTVANKMLLNTCKKRAKEMNIKFVWIKNCTIYIRANEKAPAKAISSEDDLKNFLDSKL